MGFEVLTSSKVSQKWKELSVEQDIYDKLRKWQKLQLTQKRGGVSARAGRKGTGHVRLQLSRDP